MNFRVFLAVCAGRCVKLAAKILRRGGTAKPGEIALKLCPDLPARLAKDVHMIVVTGTNGKTTSCRIVEQGLQDAGIDCAANRSGANLMSGLATMLLENAGLTGKPRKTVAVFECDEAAFRKVVPMVQPEVVLVTNLFRDQLDRYGSMENVRGYIRDGILGAPNAKVVLNADCSLTASLAREIPNEVSFFGFGPEMQGGPVPEVSAAPNCIFCGAPYEYDYRVYGHLGGFKCPSCDNHRPDAQVELMEFVSRDADSSIVSLRMEDKMLGVKVNLPGTYNAYNAIAAVTALMAYGVDRDVALQACGHFACGFGRMEKMRCGNMSIRMILVKNAVGCDQTIDYMCGTQEDFLPVFLLNNQAADGVDFSWIEDVNYEKLAERCGDKVLVSGSCAEELADRLVRAGFVEEGVIVERDLDKLVQRMADQGGSIFVVPNYSSMLEIHGRLAKLCNVNQFWQS